jgi:hypothetical protein
VARTTAPTKTILVSVVITDARMVVALYQLDSIGQYVPFVGAVPRGNYLKFNVLNHGKKPHNFAVFGKKTRLLKPGGKAHLFKQTNVRGKFPYASTLDRGKRFRGSITVF